MKKLNTLFTNSIPDKLIVRLKNVNNTIGIVGSITAYKNTYTIDRSNLFIESTKARQTSRTVHNCKDAPYTGSALKFAY